MTKRGLLWDSPSLRAGVREIDMWSESWAESSVVNGRVLGSLCITQREVCELHMLYILYIKWISLRVRELPVGQSV